VLSAGGNAVDARRVLGLRLTLYFATNKPAEAPDGNWLPIPKGQKFRLTFRFYGPLDGVANGTYWPPTLVKLN